MKPPSVLRVLSRPTALLKAPHPPKIAQLPALDARKFTATTRRPFLDGCLLQTHTLISGIHGMTGLPWAATIPLFAFLVRMFIHLPLTKYCYKLDVKRLRLYKETRDAVEKNAKLEDGAKSPQERQRIRDKAVNLLWRRMVKQNKAQYWKSYILYLNVPIWVTIMETIRRMTGTEDGMLSLITKTLTAQLGKQNPEPVTIADELVPIEPSLATEGMLWFDNLMIPDPLSILPFALSGFVYLMYSTRKGIIDFHPPPGSSPELSIHVQSINERKARILKFGALLIGPATLMFPSAMLLYWFSSSLAAVTVEYLFNRWLKRSRVRIVLLSKSPGNNQKPQTQPYRPPTMKELKAQKRKDK